jgi:hypothetical protein
VQDEGLEVVRVLRWDAEFVFLPGEDVGHFITPGGWRPATRPSQYVDATRLGDFEEHLMMVL